MLCIFLLPHQHFVGLARPFLNVLDFELLVLACILGLIALQAMTESRKIDFTDVKRNQSKDSDKIKRTDRFLISYMLKKIQKEETEVQRLESNLCQVACLNGWSEERLMKELITAL